MNRREQPGARAATMAASEDAIRDLRALLWPPEDPDQQWDGDTLPEVARILELHGFGRDKELG